MVHRMFVCGVGFAGLCATGCVASLPAPRPPVAEPAVRPPSAVKPDAPSPHQENWSDVGREDGRVEMAAAQRVFLVATSTGLHLLEGAGCEHTGQGALVRLAEDAEGCTHNRMFDPATYQSCAVVCRRFFRGDAPPLSPRTGALLAYAGDAGQYLVVQTFNGFRTFERQPSCKDAVPLGVEVEFEASPEGCSATSIRPPDAPGGRACALWCRS